MTDNQIIEKLKEIERNAAVIRLAMSDKRTRFIGRLIQVICHEFDVELNDLLGASRKPPLPDARFVFAWWARKYYTLKEIGEHLGGRDHSTTVYYMSRYEQLYGTDQTFTLLADLVAEQMKLYEQE